MIVSIIVAAANNDVIGRDDNLPWRLSSDLKRFKKITMGHPIIMGRKTYESIDRLLPGRTTIIVTRNRNYQVPGALIAGSVDEALGMARQVMAETRSNDGSAENARESDRPSTECFVIGGAEIYRHAFPLADRIYLTRVDADPQGDTWLPDLDWSQFRMISEQPVPADSRNEFPSVFQVFERLPENPDRN